MKPSCSSPWSPDQNLFWKLRIRGILREIQTVEDILVFSVQHLFNRSQLLLEKLLHYINEIIRFQNVCNVAKEKHIARNFEHHNILRRRLQKECIIVDWGHWYWFTLYVYKRTCHELDEQTSLIMENYDQIPYIAQS